MNTWYRLFTQSLLTLELRENIHVSYFGITIQGFPVTEFHELPQIRTTMADKTEVRCLRYFCENATKSKDGFKRTFFDCAYLTENKNRY